MRILAFAASLRKGSFNRKLIAVAADLARREGVEVDLADFREFEMPMYDGDVEAASGLPPGALELERRVEEAQAIMISSPEYNFSMPGTLKNAIDWVSRARPMPWKGKSIYLMSASPSAVGGVRGLWQTRVPLEGCGALVFPEMFSLPHADRAFDGGRLADAKLAERLAREVCGFIHLAKAIAPLCGAESTEPQRREPIAAALEDQTRIQPPSANRP